MGWLWYHKDPSESTIDHLTRRLYPPEALAKSDAKLLMARKVGGACYFAIRCPADDALKRIYQPDEHGYVVYCDVILTKTANRHHNFGYNVFTETAGPYESTCPLTLLLVLSPLQPEYAGRPQSAEWATNWRERCRENAAVKKVAAKLTDGTRVRLPEAVRFRDGTVRQEFVVRVLTYHGRKQVVFESQGALYRLTGNDRRALTLVDDRNETASA